MAPTALATSSPALETTTSTTASLPTGDFSNYDHITWWVSNALQTAEFYVNKMGFKSIAFAGLETQSKDVAARVVECAGIRMVFMSALRHKASLKENQDLVNAIHSHVATHGDGVKDVAFGVDDVHLVYEAAIQAGAEPVQAPRKMSDEFGFVVLAKIKSFGDTTHTLIDRSNYSGAFLPGYRATPKHIVDVQARLNKVLGAVPLGVIDHAVGNQDWNDMDEVCDFYERTFGFHRFWSPDDNMICTEYSALNTCVMASSNEKVKIPINEPAKGKKVSQIEEFVQFYDGPGIQHIALQTPDILTAVEVMKSRGLEFITIPQSYYDQLAQRLAVSKVNVKEDLKEIQRLNLLVDFDESGYLLQLFTKPLLDRPTVFFEIIQRHNFEGFGAGNFKALFESIERDQAERGTL